MWGFFIFWIFIGMKFYLVENFKEEVTPNINITQEKLLLGRCKTDIRLSSKEAKNSITNVIITNIRDKNCNEIYLETSGPRSGKSTIFEIATQDPFAGPFGNVEYYNLVIRRSENQAVDIWLLLGLIINYLKSKWII